MPDEAWEVPLRILYGHVFERLKRRGCTWRYASPGLNLLRFKDEAGEPDPASYDPASAVRKVLEEEPGAGKGQPPLRKMDGPGLREPSTDPATP